MDERTIGKQIILGRIIKYVSDCVINEKAPYINEEKLYQWFDENSICLQEILYVYRGTHIDRMAPDVYNILTQNDESLKSDFLLQMLHLVGDRFIKDYMEINLKNEKYILDCLVSYFQYRYKELYRESKQLDTYFFDYGIIKLIMKSYYDLFAKRIRAANKYIVECAIAEILKDRFSANEIRCILKDKITIL